MIPDGLPTPPFTGPFWSLAVPAALLLVTIATTWLLYRHFDRSTRPSIGTTAPKP